MSSLIERMKTSFKRRFLIPAVAAVAIFGLATYEFASPAKAAPPLPAPAAAGLDDSSVSALTALDKAMETLAARVTPAIVNVTVTSKMSGKQSANMQDDGDDDDDNGLQQFFGPNSPFGQNPFGGRRMQPRQPQIEHGLGTGVIISPDGYIVTNNHVVDGATDIRVTLTDRRILKAKVIGTDALTDLAVIKVDESNLPSVPW